MSIMSSCLPFTHAWSTREYSGRAIYSGFRKCLKCSREETRLYDFQTESARWVKGRFVLDDVGGYEHVFIFAGSAFSFRDMVSELSAETKGRHVAYTFMENEDGWKEMEPYSYPYVILTHDWKENPLIDDYRFARLVMTGHT